MFSLILRISFKEAQSFMLLCKETLGTLGKSSKAHNLITKQQGQKAEVRKQGNRE